MDKENLTCPFCSKELLEEISFRSTCPHCHRDLHCCKVCQFYDESKPNACVHLDIDPVFDKERSNLCEHYKLNTAVKPSSNVKNLKKGFDDLFKD
jgi:hypothetical protein